MGKKRRIGLPAIANRAELLKVKRACCWLVYGRNSPKPGRARRHTGGVLTFAELAGALETSTARVSHIANGRWYTVRVSEIEGRLIVALARFYQNAHKASQQETQALALGFKGLASSLRNYETAARLIAQRRSRRHGSTAE